MQQNITPVEMRPLMNLRIVYLPVLFCYFRYRFLFFFVFCINLICFSLTDPVSLLIYEENEL